MGRLAPQEESPAAEAAPAPVAEYQEVDYEQVREDLHTQLVDHRLTWRQSHQRYIRSLALTKKGLVCGDAEVAEAYEVVNNRMDSLLEKYFSACVHVGAIELS